MIFVNAGDRKIIVQILNNQRKIMDALSWKFDFTPEKAEIDKSLKDLGHKTDEH